MMTDDDVNDNDKIKMVLDMYEQCGYKMQIIHRKTNYEGTYECHTQQAEKNHSNMNNKK